MSINSYKNKSKNRPNKPAPQQAMGRRSMRSAPTREIADNQFFVDSESVVREYLAHKPQAILKLFTQRADWLQQARSTSSIQVLAPREDGVLAIVREEPMDWSDFKPAQDQELILCLDHIVDPRNVGAILRSAAFFGVKTVIAPQDRQAMITPASFSTCMGALALLRFYSVVNVTRTLRELKDKNYWIVGADMDGETLQQAKKLGSKRVLVLGAEDKGLSRLVREQCDLMVAIPGAQPRVESLNVSVAAGILLHGFFES